MIPQIVLGEFLKIMTDVHHIKRALKIILDIGEMELIIYINKKF